jgi:dTDP-glucose pyrophosphorylase
VAESIILSIADRTSTLRTCVQRFAESHHGVVVFVDDAGRFIGLLTAGDVFRLIARGVGLDDSVQPHINVHPITVAPDFAPADVLKLMAVRGVTHIPVVRRDGTVERILTQAALLKERVLSNRAVIMAGGDGLRLRPLTDTIPKALVEVNGKPVLQLIVERLRQFGITDIILCVRYRGDAIRQAVGDGSAWNVNISYIEEEAPLGTAGALGLIRDTSAEPFFVLNCDVVSDIDLVSMHRFHQLNQSQLTVAVKSHQLEVPFGVVEVDHERVVRLSEKPKLNFYVNAGIYLLEASARLLIPPGQPYDVTDLILDLLKRNANVCSFPIRSVWFDIGDRETLERVQTLGL